MTADPSRTLREAASEDVRAHHGLVNVVAFLASLVFTFVVAAPRLPAPTIDLLSSKLEYFKNDKDNYQAIFIGSSRVYRNIVPGVLEEEMALAGSQAKLFNFGVAGMRVPESVYLLRELIEMKPARLKWVFIELQHFDTAIAPRNYLSDRLIWWHSWPETLLAWKGALASGQPWPTRLREVWDHGRHYLYKLSGIGRATGWLPSVEPPLDEVALMAQVEELLRAGAGYVALEWDKNRIILERRREFLEGLEQFEADVEQLKKKQGYTPELLPYHLMVIDEMIALVDEMNPRPQLVFVIMPSLMTEQHFKQAADEGLIPRLVTLNEPRAYPYLYETDQRFDRAHLKRQASVAATRIIVRQLTELLQEENQARRRQNRRDQRKQDR